MLNPSFDICLPTYIHLACLEALKVGPQEAVFLDDLGSNLKAAKALGITTIKVRCSFGCCRPDVR